MEVLPLELIYNTIDYLPPISSIGLSKHYNYTLRNQHSRIWHAIFRNDEYAVKVATELGLKLVLFGSDIELLFKDFDAIRTGDTFLALACYDVKEECRGQSMLCLHRYKSIFCSSLQRHSFCGHGVVRFTDANLTLFVADNIYPIHPRYSEITPSLWILPEPAKLLSQEDGVARSACLCWDSTYKCITLGDGDILGVRERNSTNYSDLYILRLFAMPIVIFRACLFELSRINEVLSTAHYTLHLDISPTAAHRTHDTRLISLDYSPLAVFDSLCRLSLRNCDADSHSVSTNLYSSNTPSSPIDYSEIDISMNSTD